MKFTIRVPIFYTYITFSDCADDVFYTEEEQETAYKAYGQTGWYPERGVSIYIQPNAPVDTLIHECVHAAGLILKFRGITYGTPPDDEILAYLTGWIYENLNKQINRKKV